MKQEGVTKSWDVVVIGASAAGVTAALTARRHYPNKSVLVLRKERLIPIPCGIPYVFGVVGMPEKNLIPADDLLAKEGIDSLVGEAESINRHPGCMPGGSALKVKLLFEAGRKVILGGQVSGAKSGGELINVISACIHQRMTADEIATFQTGTHPALTASPIAYQLVNAAEMAIRETKARTAK